MIDRTFQTQVRTGELSRLLNVRLAYGTRLEVLLMQTAYIIDKTAPFPHFRDVLKKGMDNHQWIKSVRIEAFDDDNFKHAELKIDFDWKKWKLNIITKGNEVFLDGSIPTGECLSGWIGTMVDYFNSLVSRNRLNTRCLFPLIDEVRQDAAKFEDVLKLLNLVKCTPKPWIAEKEITNIIDERPPQLDELSVCLTVAS